MKSNKTHIAPDNIENLGDGTFYYNFDVIESEMEDGTPNFDYNQVRCKYPIDIAEVQGKVSKINENHVVVI